MEKCKFNYLSNQVEVLYEHFVSNIYADTHPFSKRIVIVPSPAMKTWLVVKMSQDPRLRICTGIEICHLEEGLEKVYSLLEKSKKKMMIPTDTELSIKIELEIRKNLEQSKEDLTWKELKKYLKTGKKASLRLIALSDKLAHLFKQYGRYAKSMIDEWERSFEEKNWQAAIWNCIYHQSKVPWTFHSRQYKEFDPGNKSSFLQLHLFAISHLSALQAEFLSNISTVCTVSHYLLSPCALFWSDIRSDKERIFIQNYWKDRGASCGEQQLLEEFLRDRNPLLANFGRLGREMARLLEEFSDINQEAYILSSHIREDEHYTGLYSEDFYFDTRPKTLTLLHALQADMLLLRNPDPEDKIDLVDDSSIQLHVAANKFREVEVLYHNILKIIEESEHKQERITPADVIVLTPDIVEYEPYIKAVFGSSESLLDCKIMDLNVPSQSGLIQAFLHILNLASSRFDSKSVLELFEFPAFYKKLELSFEDLELIRKWVKKSGIVWGSCATHRDEILLRNHCQEGMVDKRLNGTWEGGLSLLLQSLVFCSDKHDVSVDLSQSTVLGKLTYVIRSLREDFKPLTNEVQMTIEDWIFYLESLLEGYFYFDSKEDEECQLLLNKISEIRRASKFCAEEKFGFQSIYRRLKSLLEKQHICYRENHIQAVKFCSMLPMRAIPARVVAMIGVEEGVYPKKDMFSSLNAMNGREDIDFSPTQVDYDRYLFLEILLSAREYLLMSYSAFSVLDGQEKKASLLVDELFNYLDSGYTINQLVPSQFCLVKHPFYSFEKSYFSKESLLKSYSKKDFQIAQSFYLEKKRPPYRFVPHFKAPAFEDIKRDFIIDIKDLVTCMSNPLKIYFNQVLGVYLKNDNDKKIPVDESFTLSNLDQAILKKQSIKRPFQEVFEQADQEGKLPMGLFGDVAKEKLEEQILEITENMQAFELSAKDIYSIELSEQCDTPFLENNVLILPAIEYQGSFGNALVVGTIADVSAQGLIAYADDTPENLIKFWPLYVFLSLLIKERGLDIKPQLIPIKSKKRVCKTGNVDKNSLKNIFDLYFTSLKCASPLIPDWNLAIMKGDVDLLNQIFEKQFNNRFKPLYNDYLSWMITPKTMPDAKEMIRTWQPLANQLLKESYTLWFPKFFDEVQQ